MEVCVERFQQAYKFFQEHIEDYYVGVHRLGDCACGDFGGVGPYLLLEEE